MQVAGGGHRVPGSGGLVDYFVLFFIHVDSRRVILAGITPNPTAVWVAHQARNVAMEFQEQGHQPTHLIRNNDGKHPAPFDVIFDAEWVKVVRTGVHNAEHERLHRALDSIAPGQVLGSFRRVRRGSPAPSQHVLPENLPTANVIINRWTTYRSTGRYLNYLPTFLH